MLKLEDVFKISGIPEHTFVYPSEFNALKVALRSPGRGVVIEGPSGIGKSTAVHRALRELGLDDVVATLSARTPADVEYVEALPATRDFGTVIIDDFHRLSRDLRAAIADLLKRLADEEDETRKLVVVGINQAGQALVQSAPDLANRIDRIRFEVEPDGKVDDLIQLGEKSLNITFSARKEIVTAAHGSFYLTQMLCHRLCIEGDVLEAQRDHTQVTSSYAAVRRKVMERQDDRFGPAVRRFARGTKFRPGGRAPYLHILRWLSEADTWSVSLLDEMAKHRNERASVGQVVQKGYLEKLVAEEEIRQILHYDPDTNVISIEDPHLIFYLRNLDWPTFVRQCGFTRFDFEEEYDVALSFAGEDRALASAMRDELEDAGCTVFYDEAEQSRMLAADLEDFLGPIYTSHARFVVAVLGSKYGVKRWTQFEASQFRERIKRGEVIPIWSADVPASAFDPARSVGYLSYDPAKDPKTEARRMATIIVEKVTGAG